MAVKADNVFGQVLICLRLSKLDYILKETPYSAYLTIRKKFIKGVKEETVAHTNNVESANDKNRESLQRENSFLKDKVADLEKRCALFTVENDELEIKLETLEKDKVSLEEEIEQSYTESRELRKTIEKQKKVGRETFSSMKELNENIVMLENKVKVKDLEVIRLEKELETFGASTSINNIQTCVSCSSDIENESSFEEHIESKHGTHKTSNADATSSKSYLKFDDCDFLADSNNIMKVHRREMLTFLVNFVILKQKVQKL